MEQSLEALVAPVKELNDLTVATIEKIATLQVKAVEENAKASVAALKSSAGIKDLESLQSYLKGQVDVAQGLQDNATDNAQKIAKLTEDYLNSVKGLVEKSVKV